MNPAITGALISGGSKLLGGLLGGDDDRDPVIDAARAQTWAWKNAPRYIRRGAELGNFNPLTILGSGAANAALTPLGGRAPLSTGSVLSETVGDILMEATGTNDALEEERQKAELDRLRKENEILNAGGAGRLVSRTVRTVINPAGISTPKTSRVTDRSQDVSVIEKAARHRADLTGNEGRELDVAPVVDSGGTMQITNPFLGGSVTVPTIDGDEPLGFDEFLVNAPVILPQVAWNYGKKVLGAIPVDGPRDPTVKYPSLTNNPIHLNPKDAENIRKNRY